jgi:soluble lytic murein transglycosylase-like protein
MQMAQKKEISEAMVAPILARKAELADAFARQNMMANASKAQPTVMEQLMTKNAQAEQPQMPEAMPQQPMPQQAMAPEDVGIATQATQPMGLAGGGIIAFADGGLSDDDEDTEDARFTALMDAIPAGIKSIPHKISEFAKSLPQTYEAAKSKLFHTEPTKKGSHQYEDMVLAEAKKFNVDPKLALHVLYKETGGHKDPANARSHAGAVGPMQIMPKTAKDLGIDPYDPVQNIHGGVKYLAQLGPMFGNDPRLTAAAYNAGPGNVRKHGGVPNFKETQKYVVGLASGGEVQHYANKGYVSFGEEAPYDPEDPSLYDTFGSMIGSPLERLKSSIYGVGATTAKEREQARQAKKVVPPKMPDELKNLPIASAPQEVRDNSVTVMPLPQGQAQTQAAPKSGLESFMEQMNAQKADIAKQRAEDKNMALLTAGLGMLGGTSQYAFENIGKGALAGVQHLSEANKQRIAEQNALNKNMLYGHHYQGVENQAKANAAATQALRQREYELDVAKHGTEQQKIAINQYETHIKNAMASLDKNSLLLADPAARAAAEDKILNGPTARNLYRRAYGDMGIQSQNTPTFTPKQESLLSKYLPK